MKLAIILLAGLFTLTGTTTYETARDYEKNFHEYWYGNPWVFDALAETGAPDGDYADWNETPTYGQADPPLGRMNDETIQYYECNDILYQVINNGYRICIATWQDGKVISVEEWLLENND